ncbi:tripartite motif-containing protein 2 [Daphnia magna]|uniref:tripartite motif-containing protein 2 n=1 Tax=Daphnia magna TaxID=35525 RepID=UPI0006E11041|nr:tripartite motif-containing protein 2 [Daphnia magna]XP_045026248.1 tripartite motif-containing protein 2 [Daphnia magna]
MIQDSLVVEFSGKLIENERCGTVGQKYPVSIKIWSSPGEQSSPYKFEPGTCLPSVTVRGPLREASRSFEDDTHGSENSYCSHQSENTGRKASESMNFISCPLHHLTTNNSNGGSIRLRPTVTKKQLNKPIFKITFTVRQLDCYLLETILSFPQAGKFEIDIILPNSTVIGSPLKVDIFPSGIRKKSCGDQLRSSSATDTVLKDAAAEDDSLISRIGCRGRAKGQFINPQDISTAVSGRILATDSNNQCVQIFKAKRTQNEIQFSSFGSLPIVRGRLLGQLQRPTGIAFLPEGDQFIVADYENRWVSLFEARGKFLSRFGMGKLQGPKGLAIDGKGHIYVVDNKASSICVFLTNGRFVGRFGSRGVGEDHLAGPHFIGINSFGHAIISDFHNHAVKVFDSTGQFLYSFGCNGEDEGQFNAPTGIAIDPYDNILVADWGNSRVQVFDRQGTFLQFIDSSSDPLYGPQGLSLCDGILYVADSGNHCIKVYKYDNFVTNVTQVE